MDEKARVGIRLAGLRQASPAFVKQSVDKSGRRIAPVLVSNDSPISKKNVTGKTKLALVLGAESLFDCRAALKNRRVSLFLLVVDCEYVLHEAGIPILDAECEISQEHVDDWLRNSDVGVHVDAVKFDSLAPKAHIMEKLERNDRSVARMMLELTMPVSSKKSKSAIRKCFLRWLSAPKKTKNDLMEALSPHVDVADVKKTLDIIGSNDFKGIKRKYERLVALLRRKPQAAELERWIAKNTVAVVKSPRELPTFDVRYLMSVWRDVV